MAATRRRRPTPATPRISAAGATHAGHVRLDNEDAILIEQELGLFAVLDGIGGHQAGEVAARLAAESITASVRQAAHRRRWSRHVIERAILTAGAEVFRAGIQERDHFGMGTTVVACLIALPSRAVIAHVGDSRAYLLRDGKLEAVTRDHSMVQELVDAGELSARAAKRHPRRHVISRFLGRAGEYPDLVELALRRGDRLLLCSDGLHDYAPEGEIGRVLARRGGVEEIAGRLVQLALRCCTPDNISAVVIEVEGGRAGRAAARRPARPRSRR
jgi:PPM family protein phosphatase